MEGASTSGSSYGGHSGLRGLDAVRDLGHVHLEGVVADVLPYGGEEHDVFDAHLACLVEAQGHCPFTQLRQCGKDPVIYRVSAR
jgi:hypothetical protein